MTQNDQEKKDVIAFNTALTASYTNVSCIETNLLIAQKIQSIQKQKRNLCAATVSLKTNLNGGTNAEEAWKNETEKIMKIQEKDFNSQIELLKNYEKREKEDIDKRMAEVEEKIALAKASIAESEQILNRKIPKFDQNSIGDTELLSARVRRLEKELAENPIVNDDITEETRINDNFDDYSPSNGSNQHQSREEMSQLYKTLQESSPKVPTGKWKRI